MTIEETGSPTRREEGSSAGCLALQSWEEVTTLAKAINEHIRNKIIYLEADLGAAQDEVDDIEAKIEEYENLV